MRTVLLAVFVYAGGMSVAHAQTPPAGPAKSFINEFCVGCHNDRLKRGELSLAGLDPEQPDPENAIWEKAIRKVRTGMMPPVGAKRPDENRINGFTGALEASLDRASAAHPNPGRPLLHRLNRTEYANAVRDILSLDIDVTKLLPPDDMTHGFDNIADVLTISPTLMDSYIRTAATLSRRAVGDRTISPSLEVYRVPQMLPRPTMSREHPSGRAVVPRSGIFSRPMASTRSG